MSKKPNNNVAYGISVLLITLFFGCTVEQTHKTLTFFFDGVDKVIFFNDYLSHDTLGKAAAAKREALLKKNRPDLCVHQPYKEKKCEACHTPDKRLIMAMPALCFKCHGNFNEKYPVMHGPAASGGCLNCHNQHSSKYPKLLTRQGQQICLYCHNQQIVFNAKVHRDIEDAECTMCHNPHGGKNRYLLKDNISRDANRIGLMDDLTYRHLYGQLFCKTPGDAGRVNEVTILDGKGNVVTIAHPDMNGKFYLANLHPDQNYTFRFKKDFPDCKINVMDNNGVVLYVINKNKADKYVLDKNAYETVHGTINDAYILGDTLVSVAVSSDVNAERNEWKDTLIARANVAVQHAATDTAKVSEPRTEETVQQSEPAKSKIVVAELPPAEKPEQAAQPKVEQAPVAQPVTDTARKTKIVVKALPEDAVAPGVQEVPKPEEHTAPVPEAVPGKEVQGKKSKIVVNNSLDAAPVQPGERFAIMPGAGDMVKKFAAQGVSLPDLTTQVARYYDGTVVCIVNEGGDLLDIAKVNGKGEFYLYDFLYFRITLPAKSTGILSQTIFINEKMEVIETINKRLAGGRYVYVANSKEPAGSGSVVKIFANKDNAFLFSSVYFAEGNAIITADGRKELDKVVTYLNEHTESDAYLVPHAVSMGSRAFNRQLAGKRAAAAIEYILSKGIKAERIVVKGDNKPKEQKAFDASMGREEEVQKNRRVDVYIKVF